MTREIFTSVPALPQVFARAVLGGKKSGSTPLPETELVLAGQQVDRTRLMDYQRLCGFPVDDVLPHTYPHLMGFPLQAELMSRKAFPLPLMGLVHVENEITVRRTLTATDVLEIAVHAERLRDHPKGQQVDLVTEVTVEGESVWSGRSTYLARGKGNPDVERGAQAPSMPQGPAAAVWSLPADSGRRYGAVSGDVNPIHLHPLTAKAMGFPKAIAHGMWTSARALASLGRAVNGPSTSHVWFKKPILLPSKVDLLVDRSAEPTVVGIRSTRKPEIEHVLLTLELTGR